ncbi:MAG: class II aldolase/adducin family protein [Pseudomonadota bacterium]
MIEACLAMGPSGLSTGTSGNISSRLGDGMLITPSGVPYRKLTPDMIVEVHQDGTFEGDMRPSSEWRMHLDIYRARPEAGAVVHTHSPHATALACHGELIPAFHYMVAVAGGTTIRCATYATFGTQALSDAMMTALEGHRACLLAHHGQIAFGPDVDSAFALAIEVETLARQYTLARQLGPPPLLDDREMDRVLKAFRNYGALSKAATA